MDGERGMGDWTARAMGNAMAESACDKASEESEESPTGTCSAVQGSEVRCCGALTQRWRRCSRGMWSTVTVQWREQRRGGGKVKGTLTQVQAVSTRCRTVCAQAADMNGWVAAKEEEDEK